MNKALISLGSNENPLLNLEVTRRLLSEYFPDVEFTVEMETEPYGKNYVKNFRNQLAVAYTRQTLDEVNRIAKEIESLIGRMPEHKAQGIVKIDIDIFGWNGKIIRQDDYNRPYVQGLLPELEKL